MSARSEQSCRELFRPEPEPAWFLGLSFVGLFLLIATARDLAPLVALAVAIAYARFACREVLTAFWLLRRDPHLGRRTACFSFCLSRGVLKGVVAATSLALTVCESFARWHGPTDWKVPAALLAGIAFHFAFAMVGWRFASRHRIPVWIDSGLARSRMSEIWPPRCRGSSNEVKNVGLVCGVLLFVFILGFDSRSFLFTNEDLLSAGVGAAVMIGLVLLTRTVAAVTPEECWYPRKSPRAAAPSG